MQTKDQRTETQEPFTPKIVNFRQPMVTATGIFLGFMLNFAVSWIGDAFTKYIVKDIIIGISTIISLGLLMTVLSRILNMDYPVKNAKAYYQSTLRLFLAGIALPFISLLLVIIHRLITNAQ